jgi:Zn-finger nucleic acid-binding protein
MGNTENKSIDPTSSLNSGGAGVRPEGASKIVSPVERLPRHTANKNTLEKLTAYKCESCEEISESFEDEPLYECNGCGNRFTRSNSADGDSSRCPTCQKFSGKVSDTVCEKCGEGEVTEIEAMHCTICGSYFEAKDIEGDECPVCKEQEMKKKELDRLAALPVNQRGGQKTFATKEQAQEAFNKFLNAIKSEHCKLIAYKDYRTESIGVVWEEFPKPRVSFHFEVEVLFEKDKYIERLPDFSGCLSNEFYADTKQAAKEFLKSNDVSWNNSGQIGWVYIEK